MLDAEQELEEVKREIIESRGLIIKTNNLANSLAADIKAIARRQAGYERQFTWNSAAAYFIFAALTFVGLKLASDARIREVERGKEGLNRHLATMKRELEDETRRTEERRRGAAAAESFLQLIRKQERERVIERYPELPQADFSEVEKAYFREVVARFRQSLAFDRYLHGLEEQRGGKFPEALKLFEASLALDSTASHVPRVQLARAVTLLRLKQPEKALELTTKLVDQVKDKDLAQEVYMVHADAADKAGSVEVAKEVLRQFARKFPRSFYASEARERLRDLVRKKSG